MEVSFAGTNHRKNEVHFQSPHLKKRLFEWIDRKPESFFGDPISQPCNGVITMALGESPIWWSIWNRRCFESNHRSPYDGGKPGFLMGDIPKPCFFFCGFLWFHNMDLMVEIPKLINHNMEPRVFGVSHILMRQTYQLQWWLSVEEKRVLLIPHKAKPWSKSTVAHSPGSG